MKILDDQQIRRKIKRLAIEILEHNLGEPVLILAGLNNNGLEFAQRLVENLLPIAPEQMDIILTRIRLNPANPLEYDPIVEMPVEDLQDKPIILVDDVANTGRTFFYAFQPLMPVMPKRIEVAVMVDRTHKKFPIKADYVGLSLATTLKDNIRVEIRDTEEMAVFLE